MKVLSDYYDDYYYDDLQYNIEKIENRLKNEGKNGNDFENDQKQKPRELWQLIRGFDKKKDQSYFLCTLLQFQLQKLIRT